MEASMAGALTSPTLAKVDQGLLTTVKHKVRIRMNQERGADGLLSYEQAATLLRRGGMELTEAELQELFTTVDLDLDEVIFVDELLDYLYGDSTKDRAASLASLCLGKARNAASDEAEGGPFRDESYASGSKDHSYGYGFNSSNDPKGCWLPTRFVGDRSLWWQKAELSGFDQLMEQTVGAMAVLYPKRCLLRSCGVTWSSTIVVEGAGITEVNGRYLPDQSRLWRFCPVWHHERGPCDTQWGGAGGEGATILRDMVGCVDGRQGGEAYLLFYRGGVRYFNVQGDNSQAAPTGLGWRVAHEGHSWDGVRNVGPAPVTKHPEWSGAQQKSLRAAAALEAGFEEANGDHWVVDVAERDGDLLVNWVFKAGPRSEDGSQLRYYSLLRNNKMVIKVVRSARVMAGDSERDVRLKVYGLRADDTNKCRLTVRLHADGRAEELIKALYWTAAWDEAAAG